MIATEEGRCRPRGWPWWGSPALRYTDAIFGSIVSVYRADNKACSKAKEKKNTAGLTGEWTPLEEYHRRVPAAGIVNNKG